MAMDRDLIVLPDEALPSIEELPGDLRQVAEEVGVKNTMKLVHKFRGTAIYFHNMDKFFRAWRDNCIRRDFDRLLAEGRSARRAADELGRKYTLSARWIFEIVGSAGLDSRQMNLFG